MNITFGWLVDLFIVSILVIAGMGIFHIIRNLLMLFMNKLR
ncbi:MAG: hypothetical protein NUV45_01640 [Tepidanaerobacteraceae bacterium]|nr:hypothetical protein [Tepidanaerobacteraceae bacterium]